ncbi:MAG: DUF4422 domain-containing protein [Rikenella sp.]|nr:DUF4422 domain-containing protein [Rikenella sp.]
MAYHKPAPIVSGSVYRPIHVGKALSEVDIPGTIGDDTGDNISRKNPLYCEMTAAYWAWKNDRDSDYIGLCHYRRVFSMKRPKTRRNFIEKIKYYLAIYLMPFRHIGGWLTDWNAHYVDRENDFLRLAHEFSTDISRSIARGKYTVYALKPVKHSGVEFGILFKNIFGEVIMELVQEIIARKYPDYFPDFIASLHSNESYYGNMTIMRRDVFERYASMLFDVLQTHEKSLVDKELLIDPMREKVFARGEGFIAEFLTSMFIRHKLRTEKSSVKLLNAVLYSVL